MVPHELPKNWRLRISGESQNVVEFLPSAKSFSRNENFVSTSKNLQKTEIGLSRSTLFHTKTRISKNIL